jgi:hypothetical protein
MAQIRRQAIAELRSSGMSYAQVAAQLGVTRGRIAQLKTTHGLEHEFFGAATVTIATPLRASDQRRPLVAQEDVEAALTLARFLNAADISTETAHVSTAGEIDLSPRAFVAICGPASSPTIAELIGRDPAFDYTVDDSGRWRIAERATGQVFASPLDDDPDAGRDFAYLARLPRPAGELPMLVVAGIHAIGSLGAVAYLTTTQNLHELHSAVGIRPFSMVIESTFTRSPLAIQSASAATLAHARD